MSGADMSVNSSVPHPKSNQYLAKKMGMEIFCHNDRGHVLARLYGRKEKTG
jgi:hypothetical protein